MKSGLAIASVAAALIIMAPMGAPVAAAKDRPVYDRAVLSSMESVKCGTSESAVKSWKGEILGTDSSKKEASDILCQEYVLQTDHVIYHIRPTDQKHPMLLPVGDAVEFRIHKDKLYVLDVEREKKERQYTVVAMEPRTQTEVAKSGTASR